MGVPPNGCFWREKTWENPSINGWFGVPPLMEIPRDPLPTRQIWRAAGNDDGHLHEDVSLVVLALWQNVLQTARACFNNLPFNRKESPGTAGEPVKYSQNLCAKNFARNSQDGSARISHHCARTSRNCRMICSRTEELIESPCKDLWVSSRILGRISIPDLIHCKQGTDVSSAPQESAGSL